MNVINVNKIILSDKISFGKKNFKYFIGYKVAKKVRPFCIVLPKMSAYKKDFDKTKCMSFLIKDENLLEKYNEIWKKSTILSKKNLTVNLYKMKNI